MKTTERVISRTNGNEMNSQTVPEHRPQPQVHVDENMLGLIGIVLLVLFLGGLLFWANWNSWGKPAAIAIGALVAVIIAWKVFVVGHDRWLHHQTMQHTNKHITTQLLIAEIAAKRGDSVELKHTDHLGRVHELRTISPLTIPNAPLTIKEINYGQEQDLLPAPLPVAPPFRSIAGQIKPGHIFLGQGAQGAIWGDITDLLSTLDVGRPGTGKSTLLRDVCGQVLLIGGKPIILDPHGSILDDLGSEIECAEMPQDISQYAHAIDGSLTQRLQSRRAGQATFKPVLLLVDEMPIISEMAPDALPVIRRVVLEGRKVGMFALISGQGVPASILGGTLVRDAMASRYVFCTSPQQARMAGLENETAKSMMAILETSGPGKAVLATANRKPEIVAIPDTTTDDIKNIVSGNFRNGADSRNISGDFRNDVKSDEEPMYSNVSRFQKSEPVEHKIEVSPEIRNEIIRLRTASFNRTEIRDIMHFNGEQFKIIKQVLDEEGL